MPIAKIKKLLKLVNKIHNQTLPSRLKNTQISAPGRSKIYDDFCIFKIYLLMHALNIKNIKTIWEFLSANSDIRKLCGLEDNMDRTTLNRRLNNLYKKKSNNC